MINLYLKDSISIIEIVLIVPSRHERAFGLGEIGVHGDGSEDAGFHGLALITYVEPDALDPPLPSTVPYHPCTF